MNKKTLSKEAMEIAMELDKDSLLKDLMLSAFECNRWQVSAIVELMRYVRTKDENPFGKIKFDLDPRPEVFRSLKALRSLCSPEIAMYIDGLLYLHEANSKRLQSE